MDEILELNADYFHSQKDWDVNLICVEKIIKKLQKHKIVKVTGLHHSRKTATVYEVVNRIWETRNCFYFNSQIYKNSRVGTAKGIVKLIDYAADKKAFDSTSILVFESIEDIKHAKDVISELYQKGKYRIILIGSLKHLHGLPHAKVLPPSIFDRIEKRKVFDYLDNYMILWWLYPFDYEENIPEQKIIRNMMTDSCMFHDVIMSHGVKDIFLFQSALSFMARNIGKYLSLRDITKLINEWNLNTSIITMTDYIQCSLSAGFLHTLKRYDMKKEKKMDSKWSYYFGDLWILASIKKDAPTKKHLLFENLLLLELLQLNYEVYTWMNGKFLFSFYTKKLWEKKCIHISHQTDKKEIKKEINKLTKIKGKSERYLVVENLEDLWLRKKDYDTVQVIEYIDMIKLI
jgi:predicted AAA+ superfamily ATPase